MGFLDERYLLNSDCAARLFAAVKDLPVMDVHNHADVAWIADNRKFSDPWQLFAATDHYVWEVMRKCDVPEDLITGSASAHDKWMALAKIFPECVGNPVYEWIHLDLRRLGIDHIQLCAETGEQIWQECCRILSQDEFAPVSLIRKMNIETMCSTDDPLDLLEEHRRANALFGKTVIRPTWRPDKAMNIYQPAWRSYIEKLSARFQRPINSFSDLIAVLEESHAYFAGAGAIASDHGLEKPFSGDVSAEDADTVFCKAMAGEKISVEEQEIFMSRMLLEFARMDEESGWVFQMHIGAVRDVRDCLFKELGPDSGGDVSDHMIDIVKPLCRFLNHFDRKNLKVILYCLEPAHQASLATVSRAFGSRVRLGSAWWLNDTPIGMRRQLEYIGSVDVYSRFAGMVSDSRKLLSYGSRFEMFRRILCDVIANQVNAGQMPESCAVELVKTMCYSGPKRFFDLNS